LFALDLADRVGIITTLDQSVNRIRRKIAARRLAARIPSVRPINLPVLEYERQDMVMSRVGEVAARMIQEDAVEGIILGCGAMDGVRAFLEKEFGLPVVEPGPVTVKQAETLAGFGFCHSKRSYMDPLPVAEHGIDAPESPRDDESGQSR
jgi:allantoin racemase